MKHFAISVMCIFLIGVVMCPTTCLADESGGADENPRPADIPQLASPVPVSFDGNAFENVVIYFRNTTGFPIEVDWPELEKWNVPRDTKINLTLNNIPAGRALELMLVSAAGERLVLLMDNGEKLHITTRRKAEHLMGEVPARWAHWRAIPPEPNEGEQGPREEATTWMGEVIPWHFEQNMLVNIIDYIRNTSNPNIFVDWSALKGLDVRGETRVTGVGDPKPASEVLDSVLGTVSDNLAWRIDDFGIVIISTREVIGRMFPSPDEVGGTGADASE